MAIKQTMNLLESHFEKLICLLAAAFFVFVIVISFMNPLGVKVQSRKVKPTVAVNEGIEQAESAANRLKSPGSKPAPAFEFPSELFAVAKVEELDLPGYPRFNLENYDVDEDRLYRIPTIPELQDPKAELTTAVVMVPSQSQETVAGNEGGGMTRTANQADFDEKDMDFVTLSARFSMGQLYDAFQTNFVQKPEKPLTTANLPAEPVVAMVDLQRRQLLADGTWSEYQSVGTHINTDDIRESLLSAEDIKKMSQAVFEHTLSISQNYQLQMAKLRPEVYELVEGEWKDPLGGTVTGDTNRRNRRGGRDRQNQDMGEIPTDMMMGMEEGMGMMGEGMMMPPGGRDDVGVPGGGRTRGQARPEEFKTDDFTFWAIDDTIVPGTIYTYRIRLGFFNPLYGKNWYNKNQQHLKNQHILWSDFAEIADVVKVPERTFYFPYASRAARESDDLSVTVEVYRKQLGKWHKRSYKVAPGSLVGSLETEKLVVKQARPGGRGNAGFGGAGSTQPQTETIEVDFRTGVTVLDIIKGAMHYVMRSSVSQSVVCDDVVLKDNTGKVMRLGVEKSTWPDELSRQYNQINKELRDQNQPTTGQFLNRRGGGAQR